MMFSVVYLQTAVFRVVLVFNSCGGTEDAGSGTVEKNFYARRTILETSETEDSMKLRVM